MTTTHGEVILKAKSLIQKLFQTAAERDEAWKDKPNKCEYIYVQRS